MTEQTVLLTLPWPPSTNRIWRAVAGKVLLSNKARVYKRRVAAWLPAGPVHTLTGRLAVWMLLRPPAALVEGGQVWDIANREKLLMDVLTEQRVWRDDSQVDTLMIVRGRPIAAGCVELMIREIAS